MKGKRIGVTRIQIMKKLNIKNKILLSLPSTLAILYFVLIFLGSSIFSIGSYEFLIFGILFLLRIIEQVFLTFKILNSNFELEKKIIFLLINYAFIIFTPIYVWFIHNKQIDKNERIKEI